MRAEHHPLRFAKMQGTGDAYIVIDNLDDAIQCPESLCVRLCEQHYGAGAEGMVLIEKSDVADAKMRQYNRDGSEGAMGGNAIRCVAKYLYDKGIVSKRDVEIETQSGIEKLHLFTRYGRVSSVSVDMGRASLDPASLPCTLKGERIVDQPLEISDGTYAITCVSMGNPHCVVFTDRVDALDLNAIGPGFENAPIFPQRVNTEFVHVVNRTTLRMRCYERGSGETMACGTGACAAVVAAVENGLCAKDVDVQVQVPGGNLLVRYSDDAVILTGKAEMVYEAETVY